MPTEGEQDERPGSRFGLEGPWTEGRQRRIGTAHTAVDQVTPTPEDLRHDLVRQPAVDASQGQVWEDGGWKRCCWSKGREELRRERRDAAFLHQFEAHPRRQEGMHDQVGAG